MTYAHYYFLIEPAHGKYVDNPSVQPTLSQLVQFEKTEITISLFNNENNEPYFIRCKIDNVINKEISEETHTNMMVAVEHLLTVLRLTYSDEITISNQWMRAFFETEEYGFGIEIDQNVEKNLDVEMMRSLFLYSLNHRTMLRLFCDARNRGLPAEFKFLNYYKILELQLKVKGKFLKGQFKELISKYKDEFTKRGFDGEPYKIIHEIRDKCAHAKTGTSKVSPGISHFNQDSIALVTKANSIMDIIVKDLINSNAKGNYGFYNLEGWVHGEIRKIINDN